MSATFFVVEDCRGLTSMVANVAASAGLGVECRSASADSLTKIDMTAGGSLVIGGSPAGVSGRELPGWIRAIGAKIPVIFLAEKGDVATAVEVMKAGAFDCLERPVEPAALLASVKAAMDAAERLAVRRQREAELEASLSKLTPREREVTGMLVLGMSSKEIGMQLGLSNKTIDFHRNNIFSKMSVDSVVMLVRLLQ